MPTIDLNLHGDNAWPDLSEGDPRVYHPGDVLKVARIRGGMMSGKDSLAIRVDVTIDECEVCGHEDQIIVVVETSVAAWLAAARALEAAEAGERERGERP